jgi:UDP-N-acetylmuramyl pentapeptide phosphotransferase/UDP-N-acetylglucosamine-1-phosphate transferase
MWLNQLATIGAVAASVSFVISMLIVVSQKWHGWLSHDHDLGGVQKVHHTAVPRIGGFAVVTGVLAAILLFWKIKPGILNASQIFAALMLLLAATPAIIAGMTEDMTKTVSVRARLIATIGSAVIASSILGATVTELDIWGVDTLLNIPAFALLVTAIVVAGGANAVNIIDGFNGLAGSVILIMSVALGAVGWQVGDDLVAVLGALGAGTTLGFLLVNFPRGKLFLGDGGAYFLGFWVAETAVLLLAHRPSVSAWQMLSICAYPVIEVLFSIYRRRVIKKVSPGAPDALHLHTLIYRRVVRKIIPAPTKLTWLRNATTASLIAPWIAAAAACGVLFGNTIPSAIFMVVVQVALYLAVYRRLVRGRWFGAPRAVPVIVQVKPEPS